MNFKQRFELLSLCFFTSVSVLWAQESVQGLTIAVSEQETGLPISAAHVHAGALHYVTDANGNCTVSSKLKSSDSVLIHCLGYKSYRTTIKQVRARQPFVIKMYFGMVNLDEVVVSTRRNPFSVNAVSQTLGEEIITKKLGTSFATSLQEIKGVSTIQTGATVAKPVIHGMHSNRILIVNDGVRQRGQQWGDDHAPELDMNAAGSVSVLKGADAVRYGSEALGGVIALKNRPLPYKRKKIKGMISTMYGSNGKRSATSGYADGPFPFLENVAWRLQGTYINAGDRATANYLLNNTGMREKNFSAALGYQKEKFGVDLFYSRFDTQLGVLFSSQMGDVDLLKERIALGRPVKVTPFSRKIEVPNQHVVHQLWKASSFYETEKWGTFKFQTAYQTDARNEYHSRRNNLSHVPSLSLTLTSFQTDAGWNHSYNRHWKSEAGLTYQYSINTNRAGTGVVPIIPNYVESSMGLFAIQKYTREKWSAEAGVRFDNQSTNAQGIDAYSRHYGSVRHFSNFTYNVGAKYHATRRLHFISNVGVAWRAPHVHELYSNGLDHGAGMYMRGDSSLVSERSTKWITSMDYSGKSLRFSVDVYLQWVRNFIYDEPGKDYMTIVSGVYPVFKYKQTHAFFRGIDAELTWDIAKALSYNVVGSMIWVNEASTGRYLPYIPPLRITQSVQYAYFLPNGRKELFAKLKHLYVAKQYRFDPQMDLIGASPPAYHLFGLELGCTFFLRNGNKLSLLIDSDNLLNKEYKEYTNRFRYNAHEIGRDIRFSVMWQF